jgi:hypothetical protein
MKTIALQSPPTYLCRYSIASSDMYYTELEQRNVYAQDDPVQGFRIWGETSAGGPASAVELCQMFLEYAMYSRSWSRPDEAIYNMQWFGTRLGEALAKFFKENPPAATGSSPGTCALMCLLESLRVQLSVEQVGPELHFIFAECPLVEIARRTGLHEVDLALYGVNALCQSLVSAIDPQLVLRTPLEASDHFVFSVEAKA